MKKFLFWIVLPSIVLGIVYQMAYNSGRSDGLRTVSAPVRITAETQRVLPPPITPKQPAMMETRTQLADSESLKPTGLVVGGRSVQALPSKAVFRTPEPSISIPHENKSTSVIPVSLQTEELPPLHLQPLKVKPMPEVPVIAKPSVAPQENDCGCDKK
jgi:hypothetical protein